MKEKLLKVEWLDIRYDQSSTLNMKEIEKLRGYSLENVGYGFIKENGDVVICAQKDLEEDSYMKCWFILKDNVVKVQELH